MKFSKLLYAFLGLLLLAVFGCADNKEKTESTTSTDTLATGPAMVTPSTIVTTPQLMVVVKHRVADYAKWKASYDAHDSIRMANAIRSYVIGRSVEDSNMIMVVTKADDLAKAKSLAGSAELRAAMKKGGVTGTPDIRIVNMLFQDTAVIGNMPRSLTTFTVKDWDAWKASFEQAAQERMDNGLSVRTYGHDADDNHKVFLVTALMDTAKARAYWNSDALKKRREAGGVTSSPDRFVFTIVARY